MDLFFTIYYLNDLGGIKWSLEAFFFLLYAVIIYFTELLLGENNIKGIL